ncbi:MAG: ATP-binding cassette domain-containing protein [Alphaproteobacteria bacterium]|jgi:thiamine transport system ATP-binding protein|nr:ATP-binding cassette domain-containing protein [Alphaproteobacteria bacterium]
MLELKDVRFSYPSSSEDKTAPSFCFNLTVNKGQIVVVEGRSGIGKSTLLNLVAGFLTPHQGKISWQGQDMTSLPPSDRPLSMIFQSNNLFDHLSCRMNIALGLRPSLSLSNDEWRAVDAVMDDLGIGAIKDRKPDDVSGGQQQRVALARALIRADWQDRDLLLFDEPFSALDRETRLDCIEVVKRILASKSMAALMVSHDPEDAKRLGADVIAL